MEWIEEKENPVLSKTDIFKIVTKIAERHGLETELVLAVIKAESNFRADCVSRAGAQGLMQLMPATARSVGVDNPFDIRENISGGVKYLSKMMKRFNQNLTLALAAYNAGPGTVSRYKGVPPYKETRNYIKRVTRYLGEYKSEGVQAL